MNTQGPLLEVQDLQTHFSTDEGVVKAVDGVDFTIRQGETFCLVGESGCGKSVTAFSILQIVQDPGRIVRGSIHLRQDDGQTLDLAAMDPKGRALRRIRGRDIAMIFQEPMTSLSPVHTVGDQISETLRLHAPIDKLQAREQTMAILTRVGIPRPERHFHAYPFQLSGGMRQRVMIAMALICRPSLLIADEPTTALDVTMQAVILDLIKELQGEMGMSVMLITHNLGVVAEVADTVAVMYLGRIVESADVYSLFREPKHPYTTALLRSIPVIGLTKQERLATIRGMVPHPFNRPHGCTFHPRCDHFMPGVCNRSLPPITHLEGGRTVRCFLYGGADTREREER
ncbi:MAG: dipeptide/oligopeptide/nickel ABC transporter ATP-binding protein [Anaerolineae bacterium CG2_30_64_16]|nr:MAG: dipeptide/oligopeptide/nickel ABC transporter ATP-binding protein [Anaerolineae bacterium CG2_30_64_16]